jgi:hypothetical protein
MGIIAVHLEAAGLFQRHFTARVSVWANAFYHPAFASFGEAW